MTDWVERTDEAQLDRTKLIDIPELADHVEGMDPFADDNELSCGVEDPEHCDSCQ